MKREPYNTSAVQCYHFVKANFHRIVAFMAWKYPEMDTNDTESFCTIAVIWCNLVHRRQLFAFDRVVHNSRNLNFQAHHVFKAAEIIHKSFHKTNP